MQAAKQIRLSRNCRRSSRVSSAASSLDRVDPAHAELGLAPDRRDVLDRRERPLALLGIGHVGVEQRQVELDVQRLLVELARQVHARLGRVDVLVEVEHQVVRDDRVAGREERDQPLDQVPLGRASSCARSPTSVREVDLLDGPGVLDRVAVHLEELRIRHRAQRQAHAGIEQPRGSWYVRSLAGLAALGVLERAGDRRGFGGSIGLRLAGAASTVALAMRVAGRERR